jgi:hypothetical protein
MPTARELLQQAEALMQRDRMAAIAQEDFPLLTDVVDELPPEIIDRAAPLDARPLPAAEDDIAPQGERIAALHSGIEVQVRQEEGPPSIWSEPASGEVSITGAGPDSLAPLPVEALRDSPRAFRPDSDAAWREDFADDVPEIVEASASEGGERIDDLLLTDAAGDTAALPDDFPVAATLDATRWNLMAEDIRMQVLQRIDIFTDTGLKDQLNQRLQPMVDRASADLVAAVSQHVGQLLRAYVAEAIEREIEKWRQEPR